MSDLKYIHCTCGYSSADLEEHAAHVCNDGLTGAHTLETDKAAKRKATPVFSGVVMYFPRTMLKVAEVSQIGNDQHNAGEPLHWAFEKSTDEPDAGMRHAIDHYLHGPVDDDGALHLAKKVWRAMAECERYLIEEEHKEHVDKPGYNCPMCG